MDQTEVILFIVEFERNKKENHKLESYLAYGFLFISHPVSHPISLRRASYQHRLSTVNIIIIFSVIMYILSKYEWHN